MIEIDVQLRQRSFALEVDCDLTGKVNAIVGPSGSGKTTLLEVLAGIRPNVAGRVVIDGVVFLDTATGINVPPEKRRVGYVPQDAALFPHMTVRENVLFARVSNGLASVVEILEIGHLLERYPEKLSGGERQRVALARALSSGPRLLLLDEPLTALDQPLRDRLLIYLQRIRDLVSMPMVYVTHQIVEALALSDFAAVLRDGKIVATGQSQQILHDRAVAGREAFENVLIVSDPRHYPERGVTHVKTTEGLELVIPYDEARDARFPLVISVSGEDVVVFTEPPRAISARNILRGRISRLERVDGTVELAVDAPSRLYLRATTEAADDLQLRVGAEIWLALRARAIRVIG